MKRGNTVINAQRARAGRNSLRWVATGCNFAPGESRDELKACALRLLARGPAFHQRFAALTEMIEDESGGVWQTPLAALVRACSGDKEIATYWRQLAQERDDDRPAYAGWTYDTETESCVLLAEACELGGTTCL